MPGMNRASLLSFYPADLDSFGRTASQPIGPLSNARIFIRFVVPPTRFWKKHRRRHRSKTRK